ncbi:MAG: phage holin family protein [Verrucomicrobiota bacterium]
MPGIRYDTALGLFLASLLLGVLNAVLRPVIIVLSLPLLIFTLGLFILIINAVLLYFVGSLLKPFHVDNFSSAFWGALIISVVSMIANSLLGTNEVKIRTTRQNRPPRSPPGGDGPVIDV